MGPICFAWYSQSYCLKILEPPWSALDIEPHGSKTLDITPKSGMRYDEELFSSVIRIKNHAPQQVLDWIDPPYVFYKLRSVLNTGHATRSKAGLGVPNKFSRDLDSLSWYSAQLLNCFIACFLQFSIPLWVGLGILCFRTACADSAFCPLWSGWGSD